MPNITPYALNRISDLNFDDLIRRFCSLCAGSTLLADDDRGHLSWTRIAPLSARCQSMPADLICMSCRACVAMMPAARLQLHSALRTSCVRLMTLGSLQYNRSHVCIPPANVPTAALTRPCFSIVTLIERALGFEIPHRRLGRRCTKFLTAPSRRRRRTLLGES